MRKIALDEGLGHKVSKLDVCRYMYARMLDFTPGARSQYLNFGYLLASAVVEKVTGTDYFAYVRNTLLEPRGLPRWRFVPPRRTSSLDRGNDRG